jgi:type IV pilus biogenesis protein CpaD/CtpE
MRAYHLVIGLAGLWQASLLTGCATGPTNVERDFGNSVRNMVQAQTYNPDAALSYEPPMEMDGERAGAVLETYRTEIGKPADVQKPIVINVGK